MPFQSQFLLDLRSDSQESCLPINTRESKTQNLIGEVINLNSKKVHKY